MQPQTSHAGAAPRPRRSTTATVMIGSAIGATISVVGLIVTVALGFKSMAGTGVGFELGYSNTGGTEEYVWDEQGITTLMNTAAWGISFSAALLAFAVIATVALIVHLVRRARS